MTDKIQIVLFTSLDDIDYEATIVHPCEGLHRHFAKRHDAAIAFSPDFDRLSAGEVVVRDNFAYQVVEVDFKLPE